MMKGWRQHSETTALLAPALVIMAIVTFIPLFRTIVFSFTNAEITALDTPVKWIGLENYIYALTDPDFRDALWRTFYFTFVSVGLETLLGLGVAMFLNLEFKGRTILRTLIILPWAVPNIVNAMMWRLIFHPDYGSFNAFLYQLGFIHHYKSWLGDPRQCHEYGHHGRCLEKLPADSFCRSGGPCRPSPANCTTPHVWKLPGLGTASATLPCPALPDRCWW